MRDDDVDDDDDAHARVIVNLNKRPGGIHTKAVTHTIFWDSCILLCVCGWCNHRSLQYMHLCVHVVTYNS